MQLTRGTPRRSHPLPSFGAPCRRAAFAGAALLTLGLAACSSTDDHRPFERPASAAESAATSSYDHDLGFRPDRDGFSFPNYGSDAAADGLTEVEVRELLGDSAVCEDGTGDAACAVRDDVVAWARANDELASAGHCEGMSALSLAMFVGLEDHDTYGAATAFGIPFQGNDAVRRRIDGWHATQFTEPTRSATSMLEPSAALEKLSRSFDELDDVYTIGLFNRTEAGFVDGHTVVPYAVDESDPSSLRLLVYDSNFPGQERSIEIDLSADTWSYQGASTYDGSADLQVLGLSARLEEPRRPVPLDPGRGSIAHATCVPP